MTAKELIEIASKVNEGTKVQMLERGGYVVDVTDAFYDEDDNVLVVSH